MRNTTLITGGARSGKSALAERLALRHTGKAIYIATAEAHDAEMEARIAAHRIRRGPEWSDAPAPFDLVSVLRSTDGGDPRLVDCLTLWLTNLMLDNRDWHRESHSLVEVVTTQTAPLFFVTNEVGAGIVPENRLAREFRDAAGWLNRKVAQACDTVFLCVAGYPVKVKPGDNNQNH